MWRPYLLHVGDVVPAAPGLLPGIAFVAAVRPALDDLHAHVFAAALQSAAQGILCPHRRLEGRRIRTGEPDEQLAVLRPGQAQLGTGKRALPQRDADFRGALARLGDQDAIHQLIHKGIHIPGSRGRLYGARLHVLHTTTEQAVQQCLLAYDWPGNVRELSNEMERAAALTVDTVIRPSDLSPKLLAALARHGGIKTADTSPREPLPDIQTTFNLEQAERLLVQRALDACQGNKSRAAELLGITREGLRKKLLRLDRAAAHGHDGEDA